MAIETDELIYNASSVVCRGYMAYDTSQNNSPVVLVAPAWRGLDSFAKKKAEELAELGYIGFAADLYGEGVTAQEDSAAAALMLPLFTQRALLRERVAAAYDCARSLPHADQRRLGAIGFCFGGLATIELLRSGRSLSGAVSFHALLGDSLGDVKAQIAPSQPYLPARLLMLHGFLDPLVSSQDISAIQQEMSSQGVDWQMNIYGSAAHAFTNPTATDKQGGLQYHASTAKRSWQAMKFFFEEVFAL